MQTTKPSTKPSKTCESFLNRYVFRPVYGKNKAGRTVIKRAAPKIQFKSLKAIDSKSLRERYQSRLAELRTKQSTLSPSDAEGRKAIHDQIEHITQQQAKLYDATVNVNNFGFVKEVQMCEGNVSRIHDPELRGYLTILGNKIGTDDFKLLVDNLHLSRAEVKDYAGIMKNLLTGDRYKLKLFNMSFTHPPLNNKKGEQVNTKFGGDKLVAMQSYMKRLCKQFDIVLKAVKEDKNEDDIIFTVILNQLNRKSIDDEIWDKCKSQPATIEERRKIKYTKEEREIINIYNSTKTTIDELIRYPRLKQEYAGYMTALAKFEKIQTMSFNAASDEDLLNSLAKILRELKAIGLMDAVMTDYLKCADIKFRPDDKKKFIQCVENGERIQIVEQEYETVDSKRPTKPKQKVMELESNQFTNEQVHILKPVNNEYDMEKYEKIGKILDVEVSKMWYVALGMRLITELRHVVMCGQLQGQQQFTAVY